MEIKKDISISFNAQSAINPLISEAFEKDRTLLFLYKKAERIDVAINLVTNLVDETEPIRHELRVTSIGLLNTLLILGAGVADERRYVTTLVRDLIKVTSLLNVAFVSSLISEMNFLVIKRELDNIVVTVESRYLKAGSSSINPDNRIDRDLFMLPIKQIFPGSDSDSGVPTNDTTSVISTSEEMIKFQSGLYKGHMSKSKGTLAKSGHVKDTLEPAVSSAPGSFIDRQSKIVELLKVKDRLMIKDFSAVIKGVSDKTIQRELLRMVSQGVLKKEGERRWSRYSLA